MSEPDDDVSTPALFTAILKASAGAKKDIAGILKAYHTEARWIHLAMNPFISVTRLIWSGLEPDDPDAGFTDEEILLHEYLMGHVHGFRETITTFSESPDQLETFINLLSRWANEARHEDTGSIKYAGLEYICPDPETESIDPPITRSQGKSVRGFNHFATARLLCPFQDLAIFTDDPEKYMEHVQDGHIKIKANNYTTFLYNEAEQYNPNEIDKGLCRGHFLLRVYRHIFTGPSSALSGVRRATKRSKAEIHNMTEVTGRTIAYVCVQARNMLSSTEQWSSLDGAFNLEAFYYIIVDLFERDPDDPWVLETLAFWNKEVPSLRTRKKLSPYQVSSDTEMDDTEAIYTQRLARSVAAATTQAPNTGEDTTNLNLKHKHGERDSLTSNDEDPTRDFYHDDDTESVSNNVTMPINAGTADPGHDVTGDDNNGGTAARGGGATAACGGGTAARGGGATTTHSAGTTTRGGGTSARGGGATAAHSAGSTTRGGATPARGGAAVRGATLMILVGLGGGKVRAKAVVP